MRRVFFSLTLVSFFAGLIGCHCHHIAGVCDCQPEPPPCAHRAPYLQVAYPAAMPASVMSATPLVNAPTPIPDMIPPVKDAK